MTYTRAKLKAFVDGLSQAERETLSTLVLSEFGAQGGHARARAMTPEQRSESARRAVNARWARRSA